MNEKSSITNGGLPWKTNGGIPPFNGGMFHIGDDDDIPSPVAGDGWHIANEGDIPI